MRTRKLSRARNETHFGGIILCNSFSLLEVAGSKMKIIWSIEELVGLVRGRRQAHNPTLAKILRLTYNRSCSHNRPQTAACNAVYSISRRALLITRLGEQLPRPRQVSMPKILTRTTFILLCAQTSYGWPTNLKSGCGFLVHCTKTRWPYLLGLLAKIKCSICSYQLNLWYGGHWPPSRLNLFLYRVGDHTIYRAPAQVTSVLHTSAECCW